MQQESSTRISVENSVAALEIKCDQCEYVAATEKGLRQHIGMKHKEPPTEVLRGLGESTGPLECSSPLLPNITREELCPNCESPFSTGHCCEIYICEQCGKVLSNHDNLREHEATEHKHVCNHYKCGLSGKKFISHGDVIEHEATFHNNRCDLCNKPSCHGICRLFQKWPIGQFGRWCLHCFVNKLCSHIFVFTNVTIIKMTYLLYLLVRRENVFSTPTTSLWLSLAQPFYTVKLL